MDKIAFITGITGQDGAYLAENLLKNGYVVHGLKRRSSSFNTSRIEHLYSDRHVPGTRLFLHYGDMVDPMSIVRLLSEIRPTEIYNLAAQSHVHVSFETPDYTANVDAMGALRLLEAIRILKLTESTKFYQASTSEMFGNALESPQNEETALSPRSPYAAAKVFAYWCTRNYRESEGLHATNGILFNHESPIRGETFVTRKITRAVAAIEAGLQDCLYVGNLNSKRDWGHAKDFVEGMRLMLQQEKPDDYVLATGEAHSVREFIELAFQETDREIVWEGEGLKEVGRDCKTGIELVKVLPEYFRPLEVHHLLGDASKAKTVLGWEPSVGFSDLVKEMVREDRNAIGNAARLSDAKPFQ